MLGPGTRLESYDLMVGEEYAAVALWSCAQSAWGRGTFVDVSTAYQRCETAPLFLFDIIDSRISPTWHVAKMSDDITFLGPLRLLSNSYYDKLSDGEPSFVRDFIKLVDELDHE
jgi:hypothetical protein